MRVIVFPRLITAILGGPDSVTLTNLEAKAMARVHVGGLAALNPRTWACAERTVNALVGKGLLDSNGPTWLGARVAEACAEEGAA